MIEALTALPFIVGLIAAKKTSATQVLRQLLSVFMLYLPITLFSGIAQTYAMALCIIGFPIAIADIWNVMMSKSHTDEMTWRIMLSTCRREACSYLEAFVGKKTMAATLIAYVSAVSAAYFNDLTLLHMSFRTNVFFLFLSMFFMLIASFKDGSKIIDSDVPLLYFIRCLSCHVAELIKAKHTNDAVAVCQAPIATAPTSFAPVQSNIDDMPFFHVVVIGESANVEHFQYAGYSRDTNEFTARYASGMLYSKTVTSFYGQTTPSMEAMFSFSGSVKCNYYNDSLVHSLKNFSNCKISWLSNQVCLGLKLDGMIEKADVKLMNATPLKGIPYDECLLKLLDAELQQDERRKVVFMHVIGSHSIYKERYPDNFKKYVGNSRLDLSDEANMTLNEYDNSIRYTDWILSQVIEKLSALSCKATMLYVPDHGEDVYGSNPRFICGHNQNGNKFMKEIPFMFWRNAKFKSSRPDICQESVVENYCNTDIQHTILDVVGTTDPRFDKSKSIFKRM